MKKRFKYLQIVYGLGVPAETECIVTLDEEAVAFAVGGTEFKLGLDKITGADIQKSIDTQVYSSGSFAGGLIGGALFGTVGAVIGSTPHKRVARSVKHGLLIAYQSGEKDEYILLADKIENRICSKKLGRILQRVLRRENRLEKKKVEL